jgi:predicted molibdopterin-dependent oxidoreductase YjgC
MFRRLPESAAGQAPATPVTIDGRPFTARAGDSVAAALLVAGHLECRTAPASGRPRGPYCLMGACFDCLVTIDGQPNRQGCLVPVAPGMRIETKRKAG